MTAPIASVAEAEAILRAADPLIYFDVSPMFDELWTGIPVVAGALAQQVLTRFPERTRFFYEDNLVAQAAVADALRRGSGTFLLRDYERGDANAGPLPLIGAPAGQLSIGLFPSVKPRRGLFDIECSVAHDCSTLVMPLFHVTNNIHHHMQRMVVDLDSDDVTACVSQATLTDLAAYLGPREGQLIVAYNGVSWPDWFAVQAENEVDVEHVEPFFLVLGTREPRKNISRILELLTLFPDVMQSHRFVFAGRMGWLAEQQVIPDSLRRNIDAGRIVFPGFVSEYTKYKLLMTAEATIYPSFFEGFGLPVLESLSVGTPCIASYSSSIAEVGAELCWYHDPFSVQDLYRAVREVQTTRAKRSAEFRQRCRDRAALFTWQAMLDRILVGVAAAVLRQRGPVPVVTDDGEDGDRKILSADDADDAD